MTHNQDAIRVLQVHKFFYPHAGSETSLFNTSSLLRDRGHFVAEFSMEDPKNVQSEYSRYFAPNRSYATGDRSPSARLVDALAAIYSPSAKRSLSSLLDDVPVDVAHLHLFSHQLTFSVVDELWQRGVPMVATLHDYKIACPAYTAFRAGKTCTLCSQSSAHNAVRYRCVKGSTAGSTVAAVEFGLTRFRKSWDRIEHFIAPSLFSAQMAKIAGVDESRITVLPNFLPAVEIAEIAGVVPEGTKEFFIASRLEAVKGIRELVEAFIQGPADMGVLVIAGAGGDLESWVRNQAESSERVVYLGRLTREEVAMRMRLSRAALVPSLWDENNPFSLLEARAVGVPVIATRVGGLPEMVTDEVDGLLVEPGDVVGLMRAILKLARDPLLARQYGEMGRRRLLAENNQNAHYSELLKVYKRAIDARRV